MKKPTTTSNHQTTTGYFKSGLCAALLGLSYLTTAQGKETVQLSSTRALPDEARNNLYSFGAIAGEGLPQITLDSYKEADIIKMVKSRRGGEVLDGALTYKTDVGMIISAPFVATGYFINKATPAKKEEAQQLAWVIENDRVALAQMLQNTDLQSQMQKIFGRTAVKTADNRFVQRDSGGDIEIVNTVQNIALKRTSNKLDSFCLLVDVQTKALVKRKAVYSITSHYESDGAAIFDWAANEQAPMKAQLDRAFTQISEKVSEQLFITRPTYQRDAAIAKTSKSKSGIIEIRTVPLAQAAPRELGKVSLISTSSISMIALQRPYTKQRARTEFRNQVEDGAEKFTGGFDGIPAVASILTVPVTVPATIGVEVTGTTRGLSEKKFAVSDDALTTATRELKLQPILRSKLMNSPAAASNKNLAEARKPFPRGIENEAQHMWRFMSGTLAWVPSGQTPNEYLHSEGFDTALEVAIIDPALNGQGEGEINPKMRFSAKVRAKLTRVSDNRQLASSTITYRSEARSFSAWAANDAKLFRAEIEKFSNEVTSAVERELSMPEWKSPEPALIATVATN